MLMPTQLQEMPRRYAVWVVGVLGVTLGLGAGLMIRRGGQAARGAVASAPVVAPVSNATGAAARRSRGFGRASLSAKKPSPATMSAAEVASDAAGGSGVATAPGVAASSQPVGLSAGRRPQPVLTVAQGRVTDRSTLLAEFAHPEARKAMMSPVVSEPVNAPVGSAAVSTPREGVVRSGSAGIMAGNVMFSPAPMYPAAASAAGVQGEVTVRAVVGRDGDVVDARVVSGPPLLREAALEAVEQWRYRPYLQDGKPVAVATTAIVDFQMPR